MIITRENKKMLQKAHSVGFYFQNNQSYMNVFLDADIRDYVRYEISSRSAHIGQISKCFESVQQYDEVWQSILYILKVGDRIELNWYEGAFNSDILTNNGMISDVLFLNVYRKLPSGKEKKLTFFLSSCTTKSDSLARMIKR